jgi:NAD-dependent SIR2 family protein deacetylase
MATDPIDAHIELAARFIREADSIIIAAGAGMGVDSGLPDFRGPQGFWTAYPALAQARMDFYAAASASHFVAHPRRAWGFYGHRLALYRATVPHAGFGLLKGWAASKPHGYSVFTSNVDGQFQQAGFDPQRVHECHGSIHHLQCTEPCAEHIWAADSFDPTVDESVCELTCEPPLCPHCGALARPNILMFSDWGWLEERSAQQARRQAAWLGAVRKPVVIEIGAGTAVPSVRHFGERVVRDHNGTLVRINPREPHVNGSCAVGLALGSLDALRLIGTALQT